MTHYENIIALATAQGNSAIAIVRLSGKEVIEIVSKFFDSVSGKQLLEQKTHTVHLGYIKESNRVIDKVLVTIFKNPNSYTGEDIVEISCHGSPYIQQEILQLFLGNGCRMATPGEFTLRAFLNGKLDLSQAEAVADLIASNNESSHQIAIQQMRGGFSNDIKQLRQQLLNFASLIELELDFAEEDVEFANREELKLLISQITNILKPLIDSFAVGNVIKKGIPVAIIGEPNVGKSTLLNRLLNEERAIVSDIAGTTRDAIEDEITIQGIGFRFIDTAGIRETDNFVELKGIEKTFEKMDKARVILYMIDSSTLHLMKDDYVSKIKDIKKQFPLKTIIAVLNKSDLLSETETNTYASQLKLLNINAENISAKNNSGITALKNSLVSVVNTSLLNDNQTIISNARHYQALSKAYNSVLNVAKGLETGVYSDLIAIDIRQALFHLGEITGEITTDDLLGNIFKNFCIGK